MLIRIVLSTLRRAALMGRMQRKPRNGLFTAYTDEASPPLMHGGIYLKKIEFWLLRDNKKNGLLYCFNAVGKEIEYGRD